MKANYQGHWEGTKHYEDRQSREDIQNSKERVQMQQQNL
jgi:hypothetical protein